MYIEMVDETGQVSKEMLQQTQEILEFAAQKLGKEDKEMAVTFVTNERSHELNLSTVTPTVRQMSSALSINQNWKLPLTKRICLKIQNWQR